MVTISAVRPPARFGSLNGSDVLKFKEKHNLVKVGSMVVFMINPFASFRWGYTVLEKEPLEGLRLKEIKAFRHEGFGNAWIIN